MHMISPSENRYSEETLWAQMQAHSGSSINVWAVRFGEKRMLSTVRFGAAIWCSLIEALRPDQYHILLTRIWEGTSC